MSGHLVVDRSTERRRQIHEAWIQLDRAETAAREAALLLGRVGHIRARKLAQATRAAASLAREAVHQLVTMRPARAPRPARGRAT